MCISLLHERQIPKNATAVAEILKDLKSKKLTEKTDLDMGVSGTIAEDAAKKVRRRADALLSSPLLPSF